MVKELRHIAASVGRRGEVDDPHRHSRPGTPGNRADRDAPHYTLFTAGVCHQNPGPGGWAYVAVLKDEEREESGEDVVTTDMRMELTAAIKGLEPTEGGSTVVVYTASQVVQQGMATWIHKWLQNNWRTSNGQMVDNQDLWQKLWALTQERTVQWEWLGGHLAHGEGPDAGEHRVHTLAYTAMRRAVAQAAEQAAAQAAEHAAAQAAEPAAAQAAEQATEHAAAQATEHAAQAAGEHGDDRGAATERPVRIDDEQRTPVAEGGIQVSRSLEDRRLALMAECHTLEQRWAELHDEVLRLDQEWQRLMEALTSRAEARTNVEPPGWADGAAAFFDLGQYAEHLSSVATEALQTCDHFAKALQRTSEGI